MSLWAKTFNINKGIKSLAKKLSHLQSLANAKQV